MTTKPLVFNCQPLYSDGIDTHNPSSIKPTYPRYFPTNSYTMTVPLLEGNSRPDTVVCSIAFLQKRPDMTPEQFYHHWEHVHAPLVKPWAKKHGIVSYTQVNNT